MDCYELEPKIGRWYTLCCHKDLEQIEDLEDVIDIQRDRAKGDPIRVWETKNEALEEIAQDWERNGNTMLAKDARRMIERG